MPNDVSTEIVGAKAESRKKTGESSREEWVRKAKRYIKGELKRSDITYEELAQKLREMGINETTGSVGAKIGRGLYPAWFLFAVMKVMGLDEVRLRDLR